MIIWAVRSLLGAHRFHFSLMKTCFLVTPLSEPCPGYRLQIGFTLCFEISPRYTTFVSREAITPHSK